MIEEHLVKSFLAMHGDRPYLIRRAVVTGAAEVEEAEEAKAVALAALASEPTSEGFAALQAAQARLEAALAAPQETEVRLVPTGRTVAEEWDATDVHGRRDLLAANLAAIMVKPGRRGPRGLDASRLDVIWSAPFAGEALSAEEYATPGLVVV